ncbi:MAG: Glycerol-3-phosphate dehydrogenase [Candidatus Acidoferrum typicum]|nr:Glycerol-3-phosphate dehydrogenase [Candidatus Acidoferrum typicum]
MSRIAILGGGSWGTALAIVLSRARRKHEISLWVHDRTLAEFIRRDRENRSYLPGYLLDAEVNVTSEIRDATSGAQILIGAIPTAHARAVYSAAAASVSLGSIFVSAAKGLEPATHKRMSEVVFEVFSRKSVPRVAVLSGPSFAAEVARGEPTAVVLASSDAAFTAEVQDEFAAPNFRVYTNEDVLGVELAGAMKNVIAIAAGVCQGLGLGSNPLAALITRGLAEMSRLAAALGAEPETLTGLAGLGDLVLTCTGALSRNRQVGIELGKGRTLTEILAGMRTVAEGVGTTAALLALAREAKVELPITQQVEAILHEGKPPREVIRDIMERPQRPE